MCPDLGRIQAPIGLSYCKFSPPPPQVGLGHIGQDALSGPGDKKFGTGNLGDNVQGHIDQGHSILSPYSRKIMSLFPKKTA